jgi:hypothetical protein
MQPPNTETPVFGYLLAAIGATGLLTVVCYLAATVILRQRRSMTQVSGEGVEKLQQVLPKCKIEY